ncbi:hypothetical protein C8J57DRAFT_1490028 [Mycena rebaudengoi]|nr:hypothetical protein C8J57DRAFT_1490028 [Mycena rebaudengoi]
MAALAPVALATVCASHGSARLESHSSGGMPHDADRPVISAACTALHTPSHMAHHTPPLRLRSTRLSLPYPSLRLPLAPPHPPLSNSQSHPASSRPAVYTYLLVRPSSLHLPACRHPAAHQRIPPSSPFCRPYMHSPARPPRCPHAEAPYTSTHLPAHSVPPRYPRAEASLGLPASLFSTVPSHTCPLLPVPTFPLTPSLPATPEPRLLSVYPPLSSPPSPAMPVFSRPYLPSRSSLPSLQPTPESSRGSGASSALPSLPIPTRTYPLTPSLPLNIETRIFCHRCLAPRVEVQSTRRPLLRGRESRPSCLGLVAPRYTVAPATPAPWHKLLPNALRRERIVASRRENGVLDYYLIQL